ncbi:hypothetical protein FS837_009670 [Tulasnella sp. UAMH 9824]|nr:hypothetical protein FS837_009670 [Tulasnella sp. UAMH 9824]
MSHRNPNPAPAALPRPVAEELMDRSICGILKFVADQTNTVYYVSEVIGSDGACNLSKDIDKALRLRFGPQSRLYIMELMVRHSRRLVYVTSLFDFVVRAGGYTLLMVICSLAKLQAKYREEM